MYRQATPLRLFETCFSVCSNSVQHLVFINWICVHCKCLHEVRLNSHFDRIQVRPFRLYRGEDHHSNRLVLLRFSLPRLPVLCQCITLIKRLWCNYKSSELYAASVISHIDPTFGGIRGCTILKSKGHSAINLKGEEVEEEQRTFSSL